jgi:hypothetical protein
MSHALQQLARALLGCLCLLGLLLGCSREPYIAELIEHKSSVQRDEAKTQNQWRDAQQGERFVLGDGLRTGSDGQATLKLPQDGRLLVKSGTVVRFMQSLDTAPDAAPELDVQQGELTIESGARGLGVRTARGIVTVNKDSTVRIRAGEDTTHFDVEVGRVEYMVNGARQVTEAGKSFHLDILEVSVEEQVARAQAASAKTEEAPTTNAQDAAKTLPRAAENYVFQESPPGALVTFAAGETATLHDPAPPTDVGLTFNGCPELMAVEIEHEGRLLRYRGREEARASLARGTHRYRVRCSQEGKPLGSVVRSGQIKVLADAATRPLPNKPVTITAEADGRRYTVSYQNLLPIITLRWPYAPRANTYHLVVQPAQGQQFSEDSAQATVTLQTGRLGEGLHRFWFETADRKRSETGSLQVSFDFTARTAYLTTPREGEALRENSVRFAGGSLLGSQVHVEGAAMKLDKHGRFATNVSVAPERSGAVVRVQHPSTGIHYYVRHLTR